MKIIKFNFCVFQWNSKTTCNVIYRWLSKEEGDGKIERTLIAKRPGSETYRLRDRTPSSKVRPKIPTPGKIYSLTYFLLITFDKLSWICVLRHWCLFFIVWSVSFWIILIDIHFTHKWLIKFPFITVTVRPDLIKSSNICHRKKLRRGHQIFVTALLYYWVMIGCMHS